jgi:hypothetical protein
VYPLIRRHHLLLVSLLLFNAASNEALPLFLEDLVPPFVAVMISVTVRREGRGCCPISCMQHLIICCASSGGGYE